MLGSKLGFKLLSTFPKTLKLGMSRVDRRLEELIGVYTESGGISIRGLRSHRINRTGTSALVKVLQKLPAALLNRFF